jgi:FG-GAP repeat
MEKLFGFCGSLVMSGASVLSSKPTSCVGSIQRFSSTFRLSEGFPTSPSITDFSIIGGPRIRGHFVEGVLGQAVHVVVTTTAVATGQLDFIAIPSVHMGHRGRTILYYDDGWAKRGVAMKHPVKQFKSLALVLIGAALLCSSQLALAQFTQQGAKLVATDAAGAAGQGQSVALSGDGNTAIVGGPKADGTDRTQRKREKLRRLELNRARMATWRARKRVRDGLPKRINEALQEGEELVKRAGVSRAR